MFRIILFTTNYIEENITSLREQYEYGYYSTIDGVDYFGNMWNVLLKIWFDIFIMFIQVIKLKMSQYEIINNKIIGNNNEYIR